MQKFNLRSIHIRTYSDASFASNYYKSLQLGYVVVHAAKTTIQIFHTTRVKRL